MSEVNSVEKISNNPHGFLDISPLLKEVLPLHSLEDRR